MKRFSRPIWLLGWVSFLTDLASEAIYPLLPAFLSGVLGAGALALGLIEGVAEGANSLLKVASGQLSDRWRVRKPLVLGGYTLSSAVRPLIGFVTAWPQVLALRFVDRLGKGIRGAPRDAMLADLAPAALRGRVFGFNRAMDHAGAVAGPLLASLFLLWHPGDLRTLFALTAIPGAAVVLLLVAVPEVRTPKGDSGDAAPDDNATRRSTTLSREYYRFLAVLALFTLGNSTDAFLLLRLGELGVPLAVVPLAWAALHVVKAAGSIVGGAASDRLGRRAMIAAGWLLYATVYLTFAFSTAPIVLALVFLVYGLYYGLAESPEKALVADLVPPVHRGVAFGLYNGVLGLGSLLASVVFGVVWTAVSVRAAFVLGATLAVTAAAALSLVGLPDTRAILRDSDETDSRHQ